MKSISNLVSESVSVFCYYSAPTKSINFLHCTTDLAYGILIQSSRVVALSGFRESGYPVIVNNNCILKIVEKQTPKIEDLTRIESKEEVPSLLKNEDIE